MTPAIYEVWQGSTLVCSAAMRLTKAQADNKVRNERRQGSYMVAIPAAPRPPALKPSRTKSIEIGSYLEKAIHRAKERGVGPARVARILEATLRLYGYAARIRPPRARRRRR
jgi:hypothetical protein